MIPETCFSAKRSFTIIELLIVIAMIAILAGILLPVLSKSLERARLVGCLSNLRQIGTAVIGYSVDSNCYPTGYQTLTSTANSFVDVSWHQLLFGKRGPDNKWNSGDKKGNYKILRCPGDRIVWTEALQCPRLSYSANSCSLATYKANGDISPNGPTMYNPLMGRIRHAYKSPSKILIVYDWPVIHKRADTANNNTRYELLSPDHPSFVERGSYNPNSSHGGGTANYLMWDGHVESLDYRKLGTSLFSQKYFYNGKAYAW